MRDIRRGCVRAHGGNRGADAAKRRGARARVAAAGG
jgi:hypothetical protein